VTETPDKPGRRGQGAVRGTRLDAGSRGQGLLPGCRRIAEAHAAELAWCTLLVLCL